MPIAKRRCASPTVAQKRGLPLEWLHRMLGQAQKLPVVVKLMEPAPSGTTKNWRVYRSRFIDPARIAAGVKFWQANRETLARAEREYGVPAEIIVGILGVETIYGQQMGDFRVLPGRPGHAGLRPPRTTRAPPNARSTSATARGFSP